MAKSIQTTYYNNATARCQNCNSTYDLGSTQESTLVEICGHCHPFYTGQEVVLDTAGRIEKFQQRMEKVQDGTKKKKTRTRKAKQSLADLSTDDTPSKTKPAPKKEKKKSDKPSESDKIEEKPLDQVVDNNQQTPEAQEVDQAPKSSEPAETITEDVKDKAGSTDQTKSES